MSGNNIPSLLGLALRGGKLAVGEEPTALAAKAGQARLLLTASDAAGNTLRRAERLAGEGHCLWLVLPFTKAELGGALGRGSAAVAALTDIGLAAAVTERLALLDPERYGEIAARMDLKRRRAKERASAPPRPGRKPDGQRDGISRQGPPQDRDRKRRPQSGRDGGARPKDGPSSAQGKRPRRPGDRRPFQGKTGPGRSRGGGR